MIDPDLLKQLGWSNELISEVNRIAEPMRQTNQKINAQITSYGTVNYLASSEMFAENSVKSSSAIFPIKK